MCHGQLRSRVRWWRDRPLELRRKAETARREGERALREKRKQAEVKAAMKRERAEGAHRRHLGRHLGPSWQQEG